MYIAACLLDLSLRWPHQTWNAAKETSKMLLLFNRCHISFKTLETDSQEVFFFPIPEAPDQCSLCTFTVL